MGYPQKGLHKDCPKGALQIMCLSQIHWFFFSLKKTTPLNLDPGFAEALRGFDAPMVFNQGLKAPLVEVADQEVPGTVQLQKPEKIHKFHTFTHLKLGKPWGFGWFLVFEQVNLFFVAFSPVFQIAKSLFRWTCTGFGQGQGSLYQCFGLAIPFKKTCI